MKTIDINCDLGESFGVYQIGEDEGVIAYITSANIACGFHAGDPAVMQATVRLAAKYGGGLARILLTRTCRDSAAGRCASRLRK